MAQLSVAVLGLGIMGSRMAQRLVGAGFSVAVYNRSPEKVRALVDQGAHAAATPRLAAARADVVISMVADDEASRTMWLGADGAIAGAAAGATLVESSTVTVGWIAELARAASDRGCELVDAPVTGSKNQAAAGELNFLVGGSAATLERIRPVLSVMSRSITHLGPTGSGALVKLINNFVCGTQLASLAEALAMIERSGLDREKTLDVLLNGAPGSPIVKVIVSRVLAGDFTPNFALRLEAKDLRYAIAEGQALGLDVTTARCALELFERAIHQGDGDRDMAALVEQFRRK